MKTRRIAGILTASIVGLGLSGTALAQTMTETETEAQQTTQTQSTTTQSMTSVSSIGQSGVVNQYLLSNDVIIGADASSTFLPKQRVGLGSSTIRVFNFTPEPVQFSSPALNMTYEIPANGERDIEVDPAMTASLTPGQEVAYYISDMDGTQIASSTIVNNQEVASMIDINTRVATESTTTTTTTASQQQPATRRSTVRGYW